MTQPMAGHPFERRDQFLECGAEIRRHGNRRIGRSSERRDKDGGQQPEQQGCHASRRVPSTSHRLAVSDGPGLMQPVGVLS